MNSIKSTVLYYFTTKIKVLNYSNSINGQFFIKTNPLFIKVIKDFPEGENKIGDSTVTKNKKEISISSPSKLGTTVIVKAKINCKDELEFDNEIEPQHQRKLQYKLQEYQQRYDILSITENRLHESFYRSFLVQNKFKDT